MDHGLAMRRISMVVVSLSVLLLLLCNECLCKKMISRRRHGRNFRSSVHSLSSSASQDFRTFYYTQTLDHFNYRPESYTTFKQKYVVNAKYWGGPKNTSPIFVYFGGEGDLGGSDYEGIIPDSAPQFQALMVFIEHRYYGESIPFGSRDIAYSNASTFGYLSSEQALADFAEVIWYVKKSYNAQHCPVFVNGGSYAGGLAVWFRLKYPNIAMGAWGSSAPILDFYDIIQTNEYGTVISKDFKEASESCYRTIKKSWNIIDRIAARSRGRKHLRKLFNTCSPLKSGDDLKNFLGSTYADAAQYDAPPNNPVNVLCDAMDNLPPGTDTLTRISAGVNARFGDGCYNLNDEDDSTDKRAWSWQICTEIIYPTGRSTNDTMFPEDFFSVDLNNCLDIYKVPTRSHWAAIEFGGQDIKLVLKRFGSNILFTNGLRDPYSNPGILENISDSIIALTTVNGSHCLDMDSIAQTDPDWLVSHKQTIIKIIKQWIDQYHADLSGSV